jgi:hypothetical protein
MLPSAKSPPACCSGRNLSESRPARITCYGMLPDNTRTLVACTEGPLCARSGHRPASGDGSNFQQTLNASSKQPRRVSNGLSQHCIQLRLCEFLRRPHYWLARRHNLMNPASTGRQKRGHSLGRRHDLRLCGRRPVPGFKPMRSNLAHTALRLCPRRRAICPALWPLAQSFLRSATLAASHMTDCLTPKVRVLTISPRERHRDSGALPGHDSKSNLIRS